MTERDCISVLREHGFKENIQGALYRFINESDRVTKILTQNQTV